MGWRWGGRSRAPSITKWCAPQENFRNLIKHAKDDRDKKTPPVPAACLPCQTPQSPSKGLSTIQDDLQAVLVCTGRGGWNSQPYPRNLLFLMPAPSRRHHHTTAHLGKLTLKEGRHLLEVMWWIRAPRGPDPKPRQSHHVTMPPGSYRRDSEDTDGTRGDPRLGSLNGHNAKTLEASLSSPTGSRRSQPSGGDGKVRAQDPKPHKSWLQEPDPDGRVRQRMPRSLGFLFSSRWLRLPWKKGTHGGNNPRQPNYIQ